MKITTLVFLTLLTGCAAEETYDNNTELSAAKAPAALTLEIADLHAGYLSNLSVSGGDAFEDVYLFRSSGGIGTGECPRLLAGACFDLLGIPRAVALSTTDADGYAEFLVAPRLAAIDGAEINYQVVAFRTVGTTTLSNAAAAPVTIASSEFTGVYTDQWGWEGTITPNYISDQYLNFWHITDAGTDFIISLNDAGNTYNAGLWTRSDFARDVYDNLYMCMSTYDADTEAQALAAAPADSTDFDAGCGGFPWSLLTYNPLEITGSHTDDFGMSHEIDSSLWSDSTGYGFEVYSYSNQYDYLIAQNSASNALNAGLWSRFNWTVDAAGDTYYCQGAYDATTPARAIIDGLFSDPTDLVTGCGGFAWSNLTNLAPASVGSDCATHPQWMPVTCDIDSWVWSGDQAYTTIETAEAAHTLWSGCTHSADGNDDGQCSLDGTGYVSVDTFTMSNCSTDFYHLAPSWEGNCGGHDGDTIRLLAMDPNGCYDY